MTTIKELSNLKGRRALITGATGGLGKVMADTSAELGEAMKNLNFKDNIIKVT